LEPRTRRTLGADKGFDRPDFIDGVRQCNTTPHVAPNVHAKKSTSAIDGRTTGHAGFEVSQRKRKPVEEVWLGEAVRPPGQTAAPRPGESGWIFALTNGMYNLVRIRSLIRQGVCA
jgi:hypothetical protein